MLCHQLGICRSTAVNVRAHEIAMVRMFMMYLKLVSQELCQTGMQGAMASLRSLLRHCARLRAKVTDANDPLLSNLNIIIAITGGYFGQDETMAGIWENTEV
jgi:Survival motor neuron (SMN) interacting protein 1 (SIP1)